MKFIDEVSIRVKAGDGGNGCCAFRREKYRPRGGPSGGNGGNGGDVVLEADEGLSTLQEFAYKPRIKAEKGRNGSGNDRDGRAGNPVLLRVPVGTVVFDSSTDEQVADLRSHGEQAVIARGGCGGRGNMHFATATNRAPNMAEEGEAGEEKNLRLELRLLADIGVIGMPNTGKSTLVSVLSAAKPRIADYAFTTLVPTLGIVKVEQYRSFVIADVPGLIPGASDGAGLGIRFLKHVQRTRALCHLVTITQEGGDPFEDFLSINGELKKFDPDLAQRPQIVVLSQIDRPEVEQQFDELRPRFEKAGIEILPVSAVAGRGIEDLVFRLWKCLEENPDD